MTNTKTMIAIASLLTASFASSAFASEMFTSPNVQNFQPQAQQQRTVQTGANAYAQAPAPRSTTFSKSERREFNRVTDSALFDR